MSNRGRKKKPLRQKQLEGTVRKDRINFNQPVPKELTEVPKPPNYLDYYAKKEWNRAGNYLVSNGLLTKLDLSLFQEYCQVHAHCIRLHKKIKKEGYQFSTPKGYQQKKPYVSILKDMQKEKRLLAKHLGLSASARTNIEVDKPDGKSDVEDLLNGEIREN